MPTNRTVVVVIVVLLSVLVLVAVADFLYIKYVGSPVPAPAISREPQMFGRGQPLVYVLLGDSRAVGQGGAYETGVAIASVKHLANDHHVTFYNLGVSGARSHDVLEKQLPQAKTLKPDVVLIWVGANDVTHLTSRSAVVNDVASTVDQLLAANCSTKIVLADAAAMWSVPRLPHPLRYIAGVQSKYFNKQFQNIAESRQLTFAPISTLTANDFVHDRRNFAVDKFHPSDQGYELMTQALLPFLTDALQGQPDHCN